MSFLRPSDRGADVHAAARVDPRAGTRVALGFPFLALVALATWLATAPAQPALSVWTLVVLPVVCAAYGLFPLAIGARTYVTFEAPTVLLAGIVGGPLAGVLAGIGAGLGDVHAVWRRRSAYAGLAMLHGLAAGLAGGAWRSEEIPLIAAVALAGFAYLAISAAGLALVLVDRGTWSNDRLVGALLVDLAEVAVWAPLLILFAQTFSSSPGLTSLAVASALGVVALGAWALTTQRSLAEQERQARLTDLLTGALSRVAFEDALAREQARVLRGDRPAGLIVCDIDHFRALNERHGHLGGDEALRFVVERMRAATRTGDVLARWGGDELCLIAPGIGTLGELEAVCGRIRQSIADASPTLGGQQLSVTVSVGATLLTDWTTPEQTFAHADEALYIAKRTRNAVCVLSPTPPTGETAAWQLAGAS